MKRITLILVLMTVPFLAKAGGIRTAEDLVAFANAVNHYQPTDKWRDDNGVVSLDADIDMSKIKKFDSISELLFFDFYQLFLNIACDIKFKSYICIVNDINNN